MKTGTPMQLHRIPRAALEARARDEARRCRGCRTRKDVEPRAVDSRRIRLCPRCADLALELLLR